MLGTAHLLLLAPTGTDLAAQQARASFARDAPLTPVDLSWFSGVHPFAYSALSPGVMAVLGVGLAGLVAAVAGAVLLTRLLAHEARPGLHGLVAVTSAVALVANTASGRTTFGLGAVAALGALVVLPRRRPAAALAVLTALLSPVAAAFLGLAAAALVLHRRAGGWALGLAASAPVVALALAFPSGGVQPYKLADARWPVVAGVALALLSQSPVARTGGLLYAAAALALLAAEEPFGSNIVRLGVVLAVPLLLAVARRPTVAVLACLVLLPWASGPLRADLRAADGPPTQALVEALRAERVLRVEVVPLRDHQEASAVARAVPLARGWARQLDAVRGDVFYEGRLTAASYRQWLEDNAVDAVALARDARPDGAGRAERALLLTGAVPGLREVWSDRTWTLWRVDGAVPIAAAPLRVLSTSRTTVRLASDGAGAALVRVRWSRWLSLTGPGCLKRSGDQVLVRATGPGELALGSSLRPRGHC